MDVCNILVHAEWNSDMHSVSSLPCLKGQLSSRRLHITLQGAIKVSKRGVAGCRSTMQR